MTSFHLLISKIYGNDLFAKKIQKNLMFRIKKKICTWSFWDIVVVINLKGRCISQKNYRPVSFAQMLIFESFAREKMRLLRHLSSFLSQNIVFTAVFVELKMLIWPVCAMIMIQSVWNMSNLCVGKPENGICTKTQNIEVLFRLPLTSLPVNFMAYH